MNLFVEVELAAMAGKQAKILSERHLRYLLTYIGATRYPDRNRIMILLSVKAGLRAGEIAGLTWDMVLDPSGEIGTTIELQDKAAKKSSGRRVPVHPDLRAALVAWKQKSVGGGPVVRSERGGPMTATSIVNWFRKAYFRLHLKGCSSHSGRRTFITRAARLVHQAGGSLRDVQLLAGHRSIVTTERYIDGDTDVQRRLVSLL
jgi:integrase